MIKSKKKFVIIVSIAVAVVISLGLGTVLAKYFVQSHGENSVNSPDFYFTSNYLDVSSANASHTIHGGSVSVSVRNFINDTKFSTSNISYTVSITNGTLSSNSGTLTGGSADADYITVTPTNIASPVVVTATSTSPYAKTLTASFTFAQSSAIAANVTYLIEDSVNSNYATLKIITGNTAIPSGTIGLSWNTSSYSLDSTNPYLVGNAGLSTGSLTIQQAIAANTTVSIFIFKNDITDDLSRSESQIVSNSIAIA